MMPLFDSWLWWPSLLPFSKLFCARFIWFANEKSFEYLVWLELLFLKLPIRLSALIFSSFRCAMLLSTSFVSLSVVKFFIKNANLLLKKDCLDVCVLTMISRLITKPRPTASYLLLNSQCLSYCCFNHLPTLGQLAVENVLLIWIQEQVLLLCLHNSFSRTFYRSFVSIFHLAESLKNPCLDALHLNPCLKSLVFNEISGSE